MNIKCKYNSFFCKKKICIMNTKTCTINITVKSLLLEWDFNLSDSEHSILETDIRQTLEENNENHENEVRSEEAKDYWSYQFDEGNV